MAPPVVPVDSSGTGDPAGGPVAVLGDDEVDADVASDEDTKQETADEGSDVEIEATELAHTGASDANGGSALPIALGASLIAAGAALSAQPDAARPDRIALASET